MPCSICGSELHPDGVCRVATSESETAKIKIVKIGGEDVECHVVDFAKEFPASSFEKADKFRKTAIVDARQATEREEITTGQDGMKNYADPGDWIIHNPGDTDPYVFGSKTDPVEVRQQKFAKKYVSEPEQPGKFRAKGEIKAYKVDKNIVFQTSWGEEMSTKAGGWVADGGYCIAEDSFNNTYEKIEEEPAK